MAHPPRLTLAGLLLGFLLIVAPSEANQCRTGCHGTHSSKAYQEGHTYIYQLDGKSVSSVTGAQGEATLKLNAVVELAIKPDCVHQLRLKNVQINGAPASQGEIEAHALQFNYHNGHIDTDVCAEAGDTQAALNVKRAVISLFQDALVQDEGATTHHETDVFGGCPTDFTFRKNGDVRTITKYRNLAECSYRENIKQDLIFATFNPNSDIKSTPLLAGEQKVEQQFNRGVLNRVLSVETYLLKPFRNGDAGAKTVVETTLIFKEEKGDSPTAPVSEPKSLIFEPPHQVVKSSVDAIEKALRATKETMPDAVTPDAARQFAELIKVLRQSSKNDILTVYSRVKAGAGHDKHSAKEVFLDALFRTGTGESAEVAVELLKSNEFNQIESLIYYASLGFVRHASLPSVTAVASLLKNPELPRIAYLGVGSLIGKYCQEHNCENVPEVKAALEKITSKLIKPTSRKEENVVISALKALGNARYLDDATLLKIAKIAADKKEHNRVRVAALEALPTKCSMKWKEIVMETFADRSEDSEIRIKAYLSLVACPCRHVARNLKVVLDTETVNQVGSFITSHLRNLRASTNPDKEEAKRHLSLIRPRTKFPEDFRKFSYNNEFSYNFGGLGVGSSSENNVIYSQNSWFPRSTSLNLTAEVFGHSFNFLELDGRFENVDKLIEKYFGPKGHFTADDLKDVITDGKKTYSEVLNKIAERFNRKVGRHSRQVNIKEIENFSKKIKLPETELDDELEIDLSVKLFGSELAFLSYQGIDDNLNTKNIIDKILDVLEIGVDKAKHFNYHLKNHLQFLDAELVYPTGLGLPLTLGVTGTTAVHLKTSGKIDLVAIYKNPLSTAIEIALEPSASVRIAGSLVINGCGVESGLKVITTLHTATGNDISIKLLDGNGIDINIGVPKQKQELIDVQSEVLISSGPKGDNYIAPKFGKMESQSDCFDQLSALVGLTLCGQISYPHENLQDLIKKPTFPLNGPASFAVYIQNNDVKSYHFKAFYNKISPHARSFEILLETPNSRTNRRISFLVEAATEPNKFAKISFDSPFKKASVEGVIKNNPQEQTISVSIDHDSIEYFVRLGVVSSGNRYKPVLEYKVPEHVEKLAGIKNGGGVKNTQRTSQHYTTNGVIDVSDYNGGKRYSFQQVSLTSGGHSLISIDGNLALYPRGGNADLKVQYGGDTLAVKGNSAITNVYNQKTELTVIPSKKPEVGFSLSFERKGDEANLEEVLILVHGSDLNSQTNRLTYVAKHKIKYISVREFDVSVERKITYPALNAVIHLEAGATPKSIEYDLELKYDKFTLESELSGKIEKSKPGDLEIEFETKLQDNSIKFKTERTVLGDHKNKFDTSLELHPGGKYEIEAVVEHDVKPNDINTQLKAEVKLNRKKITIDGGLQANPNKVDSHAIITVDNSRYVDFVLSLLRGANPNGNLKLNLKNYLTTTGQFKYHKGSGGDVQLEINIPKFNRKITGNGEISISNSKHVANVEILYDASRDPKKRINLHSDSDFTPKSFDTKNTIEILDYKTIVNAKGSETGQKDNVHDKLEFDVTLPNGRYVVGKGNRDATIKNGILDGKMQFVLIDHVNKGGKSRKLVYNGKVHDLNIEEDTFQTEQDVQLINFSGEDVKLAVGLKNLKGENNRAVQAIEIDLTGSKLPKPFSFEASHDSERAGKFGSGKVRSSLGDKLSIQAVGEFDLGKDGEVPATAEGLLKVNLPSEKLKNVKLEFKGKALIHKEIGDPYDYHNTVQLTYNDDKVIKYDSQIEGVGSFALKQLRKESGKTSLTILNYDTATVSYSLKFNPLEELNEFSGTLAGSYGNKEVSINYDGSSTKSHDTFDINVNANTPLEKLRKLAIKYHHKGTGLDSKLNIPNYTKVEVVVTGNDVCTITTESELTEQKGSFHVIITSPQGKAENLININKLGDKEYSGEWKLNTPQGFVNFDGVANIQNLDNFLITLNFDSDKVKTRKIHAEITNKPAKGGKKILITISSEGKNIISGSTNYRKHDEASKSIIEGNGNLRVYDSSKSSSFKYTRQILTTDVDGESGLATLLNFNFGESSIVGEFKSTNNELYIFDSYCEQNADCAQFKLQSKLSVSGSKRSHESTIELDLRKFNVPYEFGYKHKNVIDLNTGYDSSATLYLHSAKGKAQYSYQAYAHPLDSGIIITLPSREVALIAKLEIPGKRRSGPIKGDISLYLDRKRNPKDKTSLIISGDINDDKNSLTIVGESKLTYPSQSKEFSVKGKFHVDGDHVVEGNLDIDVFAKRNQKITVVFKVADSPLDLTEGYNVTGTLSIFSQGQRLKVDLDNHFSIDRNAIDYESTLSYTDEHQKPKSTGIQFNANLQEVHLLVKAPDQELIKADSEISLSKNLQKLETDLSVFGKHPVSISLEVKDLNSFKYLAYDKTNPNNKFEIGGRVALGQVAELHGDSYKDGAKHELFQAILHLDERNYLISEFDIQKQNIGQLVDTIRTRIIETNQLANQFFESLVKEIVTELKDLLEHLKKARPNLKPLIDHYVAELNKLKQELNIETEGLQKIQAELNRIFGGPVATLIELFKKTSERLEELQKILFDIAEKIKSALEAVVPELQKVGRAINALVVELVDEVASVAAYYIKTGVDIFNANKDEFKQIIAIASEIFQDITAIIVKAVQNIDKEINQFITVLVENLKALPIYKFVKDKYQEILNYKVSDGIIRAINDVVESLKQVLPTKELQDLVSVVHECVIKYVKREKVDEIEEFKKVYRYAVQAIESVIKLLQANTTTNNIIEYLRTQIPYDFTTLSALPGLSSLKVSIISLLRAEEWPESTDLLNTYRPTEHPDDILPPFSKFATFIDGGFFFTFDGRQLTLPGTCSYVLAQDARDGNFSIVAELNNGHITSVTLTDPKDSITLLSTGSILVNNEAADFPANTKNLHASLHGPAASVESDYGVNLDCHRKKPMLCMVHVSGFYHARIRGILGNGNNEPWDDLTLPSGAVTERENELANAFKLKPGCSDVQPVDSRDPKHDDFCTELFTGKSVLSGCFNAINPAAYRKVCDYAATHTTDEEKTTRACSIARVYILSCRHAGINVGIPSKCIKCSVGNQKIEVGDAFSVQYPKQQADIILVVEQATENAKIFNELVTPLISVLRSELKENGITDVHIGLIGFGDQLEQPQHYTIKGSRNIDGEVKNLKYANRKPTITLEEAKAGDAKKKVEYFFQKLAVELGTFKLTDAYNEALSYDFRPDAAKTVIGVIATPCEKSSLPISLQQLRLLLGQIAYDDLGMTYHQIASLDDILINDKPAKNVVGFDADSVYTFADSRKKPIEGNPKLKNEMVLASQDVCAQFAADSGGAAFSANNFLEAKANQKKQFIQVVARRVTNSLINTEIKANCVCKPHLGLTTKTKCDIVSRKEKQHAVKHTKGGRKG